MPGSGTATIDFGTEGSPNLNPSVAVTGQAGILSGSLVEAWLFPVATADHGVDEHLVSSTDVRVIAGPPTAGVGFTIYAFPTGTVRGQFTVAWAWS